MQAFFCHISASMTGTHTVGLSTTPDEFTCAVWNSYTYYTLITVVTCHVLFTLENFMNHCLVSPVWHLESHFHALRDPSLPSELQTEHTTWSMSKTATDEGIKLNNGFLIDF